MVSGADIAIEGGHRLVADPQEAGPASLADDPQDVLVEPDVALVLVGRMPAQRGHLGEPRAGVDEHPQDRVVAPVLEARLTPRSPSGSICGEGGRATPWVLGSGDPDPPRIRSTSGGLALREVVEAVIR
jgi:hypothetical protein